MDEKKCQTLQFNVLQAATSRTIPQTFSFKKIYSPTMGGDVRCH